ncbi:MAG TPA: helix-turn-helix transcriptional regulator [Gemmatimonadaceae bacterium]|nr:helix-turn-helix transcriptional regulator [Gemmatimonadaceae bacterium]
MQPELRAPPSISRPFSSPSFGELLRHWRALRNFSQLELALAAGVSSRHVSFMESGRAGPSAEMVSRLAETLGLPLRERNALLLAAGFAPIYEERPLAAPELSRARRAIELILDHQEPYPAFVVSRCWDVVMRNRASERVFGWLLRGRTRHRNIMRQVFDDDGLRPLIVNWDEVARDMLRHLHGQASRTPSDRVATALLSEILASPNAPPEISDLSLSPTPLLTAIYHRDGKELQFFSTLATFGTPYEVTLEELRIECTFPADAVTDEFCRELAAATP